MENEIQIVYVGVDELKASEYNPRKWNGKQESDLGKSLDEFGAVAPLVVNKADNRKNIVIGGHFRLALMKNRGYEKVPVVYVDIPDIKKEKELNLRLNKNTGDFDWNLLKDIGEDILVESGFDDLEVSKQLQSLDGEVEKLSDVDSAKFDELSREYTFGDVAYVVRIGEFAVEVPESEYSVISEKIMEAGGMREFINNFINREK